MTKVTTASCCPGQMTDQPDRSGLLDSEAVAAMLGIAVGSVARYRTRGDLPPPDVMLGRSPGWYAATIRDWQATRPGRGRTRTEREGNP